VKSTWQTFAACASKLAAHLKRAAIAAKKSHFELLGKAF
jgi:hypothetical protein